MQDDILSKQLKLSFLSNLLMVLTSVHHIYGAVIYLTPARLHILYMSIPVIITTLLLNRQLKRSDNRQTIAGKAQGIIVLVFSILLIGMYEGLYNHLIKNIFFFSGMPPEVMNNFFPDSIYEMPNDFFFELTGIGQGILGILLLNSFIKLTKARISNQT
jgi:hypothetical protein